MEDMFQKMAIYIIFRRYLFRKDYEKMALITQIQYTSLKIDHVEY